MYRHAIILLVILSGYTTFGNLTVTTGGNTSRTECSEFHHSCSNRITTESSKWINCNCDANCHNYGDCCWDAPEQDISADKTIRHRLQCISVNTVYHYQMMVKCHPTYPDQNITDLCERIESSEDVFQKIPVTSRSTKITYRNIYCAICNWNFEDVIAWTPKCYEDLFDPKPNACTVERSEPPNQLQPIFFGNFLRRCKPGIDSNCSLTADDETKEKCERYFAPVESKSRGKLVAFKNKFCAFCSDYKAQELSCTRFPTIGSTVRSGGFHGIFLKTVVDFKWASGDSAVGITPVCERNYKPIELNLNSEEENVTNFAKRFQCVLVHYGNEVSVKTSSNDTRESLSLPPDCKNVLIWNNYTRHDTGDITITENNLNLNFSNGSYLMLPNSSILICVDEELPQTMVYVQEILTLVCSILSIIALFMKILLHFFVPEPNTVPNKCVVMLSISLFSAQLLFMIGHISGINYHFCVVLACLTHYAFLASFFWMNVLAYDIFKTFSKTIHIRFSKRTYTRYCLYACLIPLLVVIISGLFDWVFGLEIMRSQYGAKYCWINNKIALSAFLAMPLAMILVVNIFFFIITAIRISRAVEETKNARKNSTCRPDLVRFRLYIKLAVMVGLAWTFGFIASITENEIIWIIFTVLNGLQGAFIFLAFTDFRKTAHLLRERYGSNRGDCSPETENRAEEKLKFNSRDDCQEEVMTEDDLT